MQYYMLQYIDGPLDPKMVVITLTGFNQKDPTIA
jgi:hypothetical protein